jgi:2-polyprenyl-6-methoxyphenol hydroxylase-like FAD-dependent oxidoreductase
MIEEAFLRDMERNGLRVTRPYSFKSFKIDDSKTSDPAAHPVTVELVKGVVNQDGTHEGEVTTVQTKYLIGCDGGRSAVRIFGEKHHGLTMTGDLLSTLWGAGDFVVKTDFPDIRKIAAIHSANQGSAYVFPRENNIDNQPMIRLYTQVNVINGEKSTMHPQEARWKVTAQDIMDADKRIFHPYKLEFVKTEWWSAYPIGQRLISRYDVENRVFMAGDACHTHSPKAGQGMNTALIDSHNLSFKLNMVLRGLAHPDLLKTYNDERWKIGKQLIDFDEEYAALFSGEVPKSTPEVANMTKEEVKKHFVEVQRR